MYQTQRLYLSNCLDLWLSLLICKFLIFCVTIATFGQLSVLINYNYSYHLHRFYITHSGILFYIP